MSNPFCIDPVTKTRPIDSDPKTLKIYLKQLEKNLKLLQEEKISIENSNIKQNERDKQLTTINKKIYITKSGIVSLEEKLNKK